MCTPCSSAFIVLIVLQETKEIYDKIREILAGQESVKLYLEFLKRNNKTDMLILKHTKVRHLQVRSRNKSDSS